ncbi:hypothetical protein DVA86_16910 [Streptomyces armeniacus]|uniref:Uncharacterized protein n=1 Tax=Streptomyces armeniacus TaxID=83291 RepID=A0A345XR21_9ACTN|nr:hypothetical protein [Streptomyces armeniacus]AXK34087.1 hypothetical protein DVA86_16910 [Streptomyces armeniacus]
MPNRPRNGRGPGDRAAPGRTQGGTGRRRQHAHGNPRRLDPRRPARDFALANRLRTEGTRHLYEAAEAAGVRRVVAQGLAYAHDPGGTGSGTGEGGPGGELGGLGGLAGLGELAGEDAPLWLRPPKQFVTVLGSSAAGAPCSPSPTPTTPPPW